LQVAGKSVPQLQEPRVLEGILPVLDTVQHNTDPLIVEVDGDDGETVQVYIV